MLNTHVEAFFLSSSIRSLIYIRSIFQTEQFDQERAPLDTANSTFSPSVSLAVVFDTTTDSSQTCAVLGGLVRAVPVRFSTHFYYFF